MTGASRTWVVAGSAVIVAMIALFALSAQKSARLPSEATSFTPPVYVRDESPAALIRPLYLDVSVGGLAGLTAEQKQNIDDFKQKILARVASAEPLGSEEKSVLEISISIAEKPPMGSLVVVDQAVFNFTSEELARIESAIKR